ncbi:MAG: hypothetical protein QNJ30_15635 [Kiloniellales bacterium]|nr:hypothetical protein [Kiloniellales bacterium]
MSRLGLAAKRGARSPRLCLSLLVLLLPLLWPPASVNAGEAKLEWRAVTHNREVQVIKVGDADGHVMGVAKFSGLAFFDDGKVGATGYTVNFDYTRGSGPFNGHSILAFEDGSKIWMSFEGKSVMDADGVTRFEGGYTQTRGSGGYEGIKGSGSFKGQRVSLMEGGGETYYDASLSFVLPAQ